MVGLFLLISPNLMCMSRQLGSEVKRQGKARQISQLHPGQLFLFDEKKKSCPGWDSNRRSKRDSQMLQNVVSLFPRLLMGADRSFVYLVSSPGEDAEGEGEIGVRREIQLSHLTPVGTAEEPSCTFFILSLLPSPPLPHTPSLLSPLSSLLSPFLLPHSP